LRLAATDPLTYNQVLGALGRYSLVRASQDSLVVHRVVQAWVRALLDRQARQRWARTAVRLVWAAFPADSGEVRAWPTCARLLSHAVAASDHASSLVTDPEATAGLLNQVGAYLWWRAEFEQARQPRHRAVRPCRGAHRRYLPSARPARL
jgi:hypothetical protein